MSIQQPYDLPASGRPLHGARLTQEQGRQAPPHGSAVSSGGANRCSASWLSTAAHFASTSSSRRLWKHIMCCTWIINDMRG